jgi:diacylglycerol kinase (ATP)
MLEKRIKSFGYAIQGIRVMFATQVNAQIHLTAVLVVTAAGFWFHISRLEWCLLLLTFGGVLTAEAMNTALEFLTDLVSPDHHPLAGKAKDVAAGAVLLTAIAAIGVGILIFLPKIIR